MCRLRNLMGPTADETLLARSGALTAFDLFDAALALWRNELFEGCASEEFPRASE